MVNGKSVDPDHQENVTSNLVDTWLFDLKQQFISFKMEMNQKYLQQELKLSVLETENNELKQRINQLVTNTNTQTETNQSTNPSANWSSIVQGKKKNQEQLNLLLAASNETKEQKIKENNVIVFGIDESTKTTADEKKSDDKENLEKILTAMNFNKEKVKNIYRLKSIKKPAPLIVSFENTNIRNEALKLGKNLSNSIYKNKIYVNPDLTESQRSNFKRLLDEKKKKNLENTDKTKFYYGIRNDRVVKLNVL
jgi:hypothetical protein